MPRFRIKKHVTSGGGDKATDVNLHADAEIIEIVRLQSGRLEIWTKTPR